MCEITNGKIYVADRDLVCYKMVVENGGQLKSPNQGYEYKIGREYCVDSFEYNCLNDAVIYEVWNLFDGWVKRHTIYPSSYMNSIETDLRRTCCGFYSYTYYGNGRMEDDFRLVNKFYGVFNKYYGSSDMVKIVRCRIPEGSKYMVSDNGDVFISERIVIDDAWSL